MRRKALLDTGFLIAVLNADDELHEACVTAFLKETPKPLLPDMVVPELAYMILRERSYPILIDFLHTMVAGELSIENIVMPTHKVLFGLDSARRPWIILIYRLSSLEKS